MTTTLHTDDRDDLTGERFAFAHQRRLPLEDAEQVRAALAGFRDVEDVSDAERDAAWTRIVSAAHHHGVKIKAHGWRDLPKRGAGR